MNLIELSSENIEPIIELLFFSLQGSDQHVNDSYCNDQTEGPGDLEINLPIAINHVGRSFTFFLAAKPFGMRQKLRESWLG